LTSPKITLTTSKKHGLTLKKIQDDFFLILRQQHIALPEFSDLATEFSINIFFHSSSAQIFPTVSRTKIIRHKTLISDNL
jgi:hypothetical protein